MAPHLVQSLFQRKTAGLFPKQKHIGSGLATDGPAALPGDLLSERKARRRSAIGE